MKTEILNENEGLLTVKESTGGYRSIFFDVDTLPYWYPLNLNYTYSLDEKRDLLFLHLCDRDVTFYSYELKEVNPKHKEDNAFNPYEDWFNPVVYLGNKEIFNFCRKVGIVTLEDNYKAIDITQGFEKVSRLEEALKDLLEERVLKFIPEREYKRLSLKGKDSLMFQLINKDELSVMHKLGSVRTMLSLMRKVKEANI